MSDVSLSSECETVSYHNTTWYNEHVLAMGWLSTAVLLSSQCQMSLYLPNVRQGPITIPPDTMITFRLWGGCLQLFC